MMKTPNNNNSHNILKYIDKGSVGAEIGVWMGSSSRQFVKQEPSMLYLVDPWAVRGYDEAFAENDFDLFGYYNRYGTMTGGSDRQSFETYYDGIHDGIVEEFGKYKNVEICRMTSTEWFDQFDEPFLDWIYIDGDHSYTAVYKDFNNAQQVVKKGGFIIADDYKWHSKGDKGGVKKAINQWASENNKEVVESGYLQAVVQL